MRLLPALWCAALAVAPAAAQTLTVSAKADLTNAVVTAPLPAGAPAGVNVVELPGGTFAPAQVTDPPLTSDAKGKVLTFVLPKLAAGSPVTVRPGANSYVKAPPHFASETRDGHFDVSFDGKPVLLFENAPHDQARHFATFKPFHHVYDPAGGTVLLTNGTAETPKDGTFPHHRGLFFGFNKISYGDKQTADIWHGHKNVFSEGKPISRTEDGEVLSRHRAAITWNGEDGKAFAGEEREVTAYHVPGGTLLDWSTVLTTELPKVRLDGDPQHAGFHFRANMDVAKPAVSAQTYYLRPDGKGELKATRNWDAKKPDPKTVNLPWDACSFVVEGKRYTVLRVNHPDNPKEARGSERDYGRFGDYFEYDLTPDHPLKLKYRVWVQEGEMTVEQCKAIADGFVNPPDAAGGK